MRILVIHNFYQHAGGEDTVFRQEVEELEKEHDVKTLTFQNKKGWRGALQYLTYPWNIRATWKVKKIIKSFAPDIVHIHNLHYSSGPLLIRSAYQLGIPVIMTLHNFRLLCPSASLFCRGRIFTNSIYQDFPWTAVRLRVLDNSLTKTFFTAFTYWIHRKWGTWNKISKFIVLSQFSKSLFVESTLPIAEERFIVRPNSTDIIPTVRTAGSGFVYIGRLSQEKGIVPLLKAFSTLPFPLSIYGSGPQQNIVEDFAKHYKNIQYFGYQSKDLLTKAIKHAEALIVPSVCYEGMPMTIIEAYAQGIPVLASNIGILNKMVLPLYTGMHFNPYEEADIGRVVTQWEKLDKTTKRQIRENCVIEYKKHYTVKKNMDKLMDIYYEAIQQRKEKQ